MPVKESKTPCFLLLEDGTVLRGEAFGAKREVDGEIGKITRGFHVFS